MESITKIEITLMLDEIENQLQIYRNQMMEQNYLDRNWERAIQKYDEYAIRLDQMRRVLALFD